MPSNQVIEEESVHLDDNKSDISDNTGTGKGKRDYDITEPDFFTHLPLADMN